MSTHTRAIPRGLARSMSGIEWCDFSSNAWIGCTAIPAKPGAKSGCEICYAATFAGQRLGVVWGAGEERRPVASFVQRMRRLDRVAGATGLPFSVFFNSMGDWLDAEVAAAQRTALIDLVEACPNLTWLPLTHRPHLARRLLPESWRSAPPANVWSGVTVEHPAHASRWNQHAEFWQHTGRGWVSAEPLAASLKGVRFDGAACIIVGGASNTDDPAWAFQTKWVEECLDQYGDRVFFKQYGVFRDGVLIGDKRRAGRDLAGVVHDRTPWPRHRAILRAAQGLDASASGEDTVDADL